MTNPVHSARPLTTEGKTKQVYALGDGTADVVSKDDITAGDGAKHDVFEGKGVFATKTTSNVFELLEACGIPTAFIGRVAADTFRARLCTMLPYEVVARRIALGSYVKRNPEIKAGTRFEALVVEFFLKTSGKAFGGVSLEKDDPLITGFTSAGVGVCRPDMPQGSDNPPVNIPARAVYGTHAGDGNHPFREMEALVRRVFLVLEKAWALQGCTLCDLKIEFGFDDKGTLLVADVVDNDSWRLLDEAGKHLDKQRYRDGAPVWQVRELYEHVARRTYAFAHLAKNKPTIVLWRASESDPIGPFSKAMKHIAGPAVLLEVETGSVHKKPERCLSVLRYILAKPGSKVLITYVGRSNGAGPVFAAETHTPVIAVSASVKEFPDDVWSSLRMPSNVPLMTVLDPTNAILAALGILAEVSPGAYAARRMVVESAKLDVDNSPTHGRLWKLSS